MFEVSLLVAMTVQDFILQWAYQPTLMQVKTKQKMPAWDSEKACRNNVTMGEEGGVEKYTLDWPI